MNRAFTLIEMLIYMALLGMLLTGAVLASYQLLTGQFSLDAKNTAGEEGAFVLRKLDWASGSASSIDYPAIGADGDHLRVTRYSGVSPSTLDFCVAGGTAYMREDGSGGTCGDSSYDAITTTNVTVSTPQLHHIAADSGAPEGISAEVTINDLPFKLIRYLRK